MQTYQIKDEDHPNILVKNLTKTQSFQGVLKKIHSGLGNKSVLNN